MFCYLVLSLKVPTHSIILVSKNTLSVHVVNPKYHPLLKGVKASGTESLSRSGPRNVQGPTIEQGCSQQLLNHN